MLERETMRMGCELQYEDIETGAGPIAQAGDLVTVHYLGMLPNGTVFDTSSSCGTPFSFRLGAGTVIEGWDIGIVGMRVGGRRRLVIPPELGYGTQRASTLVDPGSTLIFEVELLAVE